MFFGMFAPADAVLPVVVLGWLLVLGRFLWSPRTGTAVLASLLAVYAEWVHPWGIVLVVVHVVALSVPAVRTVCRLWGFGVGMRSLRAVPLESLAGGAVVAAGLALQGAYNTWPGG